MNTAVALSVGAELVVGAATALVACVAWRYRQRPAGFSLFVMGVVGTVYTATTVAETLITDPLVWEIVVGLQYPLTAIVAVMSVSVATELIPSHTNHRQTVRWLVVGVVVPSTVLAMTNPVHGLLIAGPKETAEGLLVVDIGPLFWVHTIVLLAVILSSVGLLAVALAEASGIYRQQLLAVMLGLSIGIVFFSWEAVAPIHPAFRLTSVGVVGWCAATLVGVMRVDLLKTAPVARKTLVESMDDAVIALDDTGRVVDINPAAQEQFGIDSSVVGSPVRDAFREFPSVPSAIKDGQTEQGITVERDGQKRHYQVKQSPIETTIPRAGSARSSQRQFGCTVVIREITEQKRRKDELARQNKRLDKFVSVVSHDLRNPLNVASGRLELAREEHHSEHLEAVAESHARMEQLIEDLLDLARNGQSLDEVEPLELASLVEECWSTVETESAALQIETDRTLVADRARLRQLFENLFRNAVEHGGSDVTVTVGDIEDGFYVADDGPGIPPERREAVFEAGYSTNPDGTGFGLRIVGEVAEAHGWEVRVTDGTDGGARFEVTGVTDEAE